MYNKDIKKYDYNVEKAKELLKGKNITFQIIISNKKDNLRMAELLKLQLEKTGMKVNVKSIDMKSRDAAVKSGDYEAIITEHGGWGKDADVLRELYKSNNDKNGGSVINGIPGYKNEEIDKLCMKQMQEMDPDKRKEIVFQLQEKIAEEIPMIPIINTSSISVHKTDKYDGYMNMYDHFVVSHSKLTYLQRK
nr:ABC transporter substrate-binding protein [Clostridium botulinum]